MQILENRIPPQARAQARIQRADQLPQISASGSASRSRQTLGGLGPVGAIPGIPEGEEGPSGFVVENYALSLDVSWQTDLFGALRARNAAARADFLASEANLAACVEALGESDSVVRVTSVLRMEGQEK